MKFLKWLLGILVVLGLLAYFVGWPYMKKQTKKHSPEVTAVYQHDGMDISVKYCSPSKKGRTIFGELVPYGEIWRTGANEPTTFTTASDVNIGGSKLAKGTYSLWTKPTADSWTVYLNSEIPGWGVKPDLKARGPVAARNAETDVLSVDVATEAMAEAMESFAINFEQDSIQAYMTMAWDKTKVKVPISK